MAIHELETEVVPVDAMTCEDARRQFRVSIGVFRAFLLVTLVITLRLSPLEAISAVMAYEAA